MSTRMLIDSRHPEETRVTVVKGSRVEEFDYESASKRPLKGNIYLARVTRVEPSLQAAFVEYGGNRHGFLAFSEIHPDYYQIPVEDRQELLEAETKAALERAQEIDAAIEKEAEEEEKKKPRRRGRRRKSEAEAATNTDAEVSKDAPAPADSSDAEGNGDQAAETKELEANDKDEAKPESDKKPEESENEEAKTADSSKENVDAEASDENSEDDETPDAIEGDEADRDAEIAEAAAQRQAMRALKRRYSIQEVIKRRQVLLVQVVKEERGNKGAALTTYMSLAGRYCVLMPNSTHSGGISRKISNASDRRNLKKIIASLNVPNEMGLIVRTAGMERTKTEIKRDYEYLLRLWGGIRELTLQSVAPTLVYEEGNLIKRTIRDLYTRDIDEILVEGESGYKAAKEFMKLLMPSHAKKVQHYKDPIPLFHRYQVESHLEAMYQPVVQLKSGGYIVINPTEALISIDVNSGRATKEHNIEETALKTNLESAEEVARQLRLRDMAGLVVIDFIDMEERGNNRAVERRMKEALKSDRARIQVGRISSFGLMEMSRQRMRSNLLEVSMETCTACSGTGIVRSVESAALTALRQLEEEGIRGRSALVRLAVCPDVAVYILNKKRKILSGFEEQYHFEIEVLSQPSMGPSDIEITREVSADGKQITSEAVRPDTDAPETGPSEKKTEHPARAEQSDGEKPARKRRRRRRRRRGGGNEDNRGEAQAVNAEADIDTTSEAPAETEASDADAKSGDTDEKPRRRRGSRGGRRRNERNRRDNNENAETSGEDEGNQAQAENVEGQSEAPTQEKPRRTRRRKKPDTDETAEAVSDEKPADSDAEKPRRTRRRKKVDGEEAPAAEAKAEEKPKTTRRKKTAKADDADAKSETSDEAKRTRARRKPKSAEDKPEAEEKPKQPRRRAAKKADAEAEPKAPATDKPVTTQSTGSGGDSVAASADGPKRKGWWQRTFG